MLAKTLYLFQLFQRQLRLIGSFGCNLRNIRNALDKLAEGTVKPIVDLEIPMEEIEKGLRELDKRQGFRGPLKKLAPEEIEAFAKSVQSELDENPLEVGQVVKGVVIKVDDKNKTVTVRIGNSLGRIALADMKWARKPDIEVAYYEVKVQRPSEALRSGDVIFVKAK